MNKEPQRRIVVIQTAPTATRLIQVTELMSEEELAQAKKERPDLIFRYAADLVPVTSSDIEMVRAKEKLGQDIQEVLNVSGLSHSGMTLPVDYHERLDRIIHQEEKEPDKESDRASKLLVDNG